MRYLHRSASAEGRYDTQRGSVLVHGGAETRVSNPFMKMNLKPDAYDPSAGVAIPFSQLTVADRKRLLW